MRPAEKSERFNQTVREPASGAGQVLKQTFSLDGSDRISTTKDYTDTVQLKETLNHYDSDSDNPAWTQTKARPDANTAWTTTWNRYLSDLTGGLAIDLDDAGQAVLQLANLHGDIIANATIGQAGINAYTETDEYGQPKTPTPGARYGWLGTHQRDTNTIGGLVLMGARLYNSATGLFLSIDRVQGGNDNRYIYPTDPVNTLDLDGLTMRRGDGGGGWTRWWSLGPRGRLFGNDSLGASARGIFNNSPKGSGKRALGWSVHRARLVFRYKTKSGRHINIFFGRRLQP